MLINLAQKSAMAKGFPNNLPSPISRPSGPSKKDETFIRIKFQKQIK